MRSCNHCCCGKAISIPYSVVYVSGMQCACVVLLSVTCPAVQYFSTLSHKRKDFEEKKVIKYKTYVLLFSTTFVWNFSHSKKSWETYDQKYIGFNVKFPLFPSNFNVTWIFSTGLKFHQNPSRGSRVVPCRWTDWLADRQTCQSKQSLLVILEMLLKTCTEKKHQNLHSARLNATASPPFHVINYIKR